MSAEEDRFVETVLAYARRTDGATPEDGAFARDAFRRGETDARRVAADLMLAEDPFVFCDSTRDMERLRAELEEEAEEERGTNGGGHSGD
ncbi:hypothetical protein [Caenispirillum salinarum]|uniref:hypothetical protein n=1 Tax=Caenispirillum salinarum TaxID=859058 RepID=UPI00384DDE3C